MIKITCTSCNKPLSLDETKLPMKEVSFPCPVCKTKLNVDRRKLGAEGAPAAAAPAVQQAAAPLEDDDEGDDHENEFGAKAFIVGTDSPALKQAAKLIGYLPVVYQTAEQARDRFMQDAPQVIFINPPQMTPPPLEGMAPIIALMPPERRKSFFILVSDNLRTLDGNAAFLYGVNLVVATKDLGNFPQIFKDAYTYHERLYLNMTSVMRAQENA
ncbi:MAG TPA: hypothetical protein VFM36_05190 [Thermoanaerobaculia bacterium]|nr:hypothetical protein [Thermoanaerobaculia bacterium]